MSLPFNIQAQLYRLGDATYKLVCCSLDVITTFAAFGFDAAERYALSQLYGRVQYKKDNLKSLSQTIEEALD